ncbi:acetate uptake transporter [Caldivirga sp.]|uniref:acetate uptake transporter n=1 Tax=Caldivirga sp. TaxID=2080243 RepID=UPI003D13A996
MASTTVTIKKADPTALGIFSYGFSLFILSIYAMGFYPWSESIVMIAPALVFGGVFLLVAANWEYNNGNTFGATAFGTYSAFFLTFAVAHMGIVAGWFSSLEVAHLVGLLAVAFAIMTFLYWVGSFKMNLALNLTLLLLLLTSSPSLHWPFRALETVHWFPPSLVLSLGGQLGQAACPPF